MRSSARTDHEGADDFPTFIFTFAHGEAVNPSVMRSMRTLVLPAYRGAEVVRPLTFSTREASVTKPTKKSKRPAWLAKTATAYDIICIIRDGLNDDQQIEPSRLRIVAECMAGAFDFTGEEMGDGEPRRRSRRRRRRLIGVGIVFRPGLRFVPSPLKKERGPVVIGRTSKSDLI
jgi:hypothetical protein